jgi:hypothetical protein
LAGAALLAATAFRAGTFRAAPVRRAVPLFAATAFFVAAFLAVAAFAGAAFLGLLTVFVAALAARRRGRAACSPPDELLSAMFPIMPAHSCTRNQAKVIPAPA